MSTDSCESGKRVVASLKLPMTYDADELLGEVESIRSDWWISHFNKGGYVGQWSIAPLRGPAGESHPIRMAYSDPCATEWVDTPLLKTCPAIERVIATLQCPVMATRLLRLAPNAEILEHRDHELGFEDGEIRLHVPIETSPLVEFWLDGQRISMQRGELWYLNVNLPHRAGNLSSSNRTHLVIDCKVNDWVRTLFDETLQGMTR